MGAEDINVQKIKQTLKYGEQRRTLWLNTDNKDEAGRHRGYVLYGLNVEVIGATVIKIYPGAVVTPYGTRLFIEQYSGNPGNGEFNEIDVAASVPGLFSTLQDDYPVVLVVYLDIPPLTPSLIPAVDDLQTFASAGYKFKVKVVPHSELGIKPTTNIVPRDAILLKSEYDANKAPNFAASGVSDVNNQTRFYQPGNAKYTASLTFGQIPLGYFILGCDENGSRAVNLQSAGVEYVQIRNLFDSVCEVVGHDIFMGRHGKTITYAPTATALSQVAGKSKAGPDASNLTTELASPKYGTTEPESASISLAGEEFISDEDKQSWNNATWETYRRPNLLRDGDSIVWALRRLDYVLRLWMDRTGCQDIVSTIQDGNPPDGLVLEHCRPRMTLDAILAHYKGNDGDADENANLISYSDNSPSAGSNPANHTVKSGKAAHDILTLSDVDDSGFGDNLANASSALNLALYHVLKDVFGRDFSRQALRKSYSWRNGEVVNSSLGALKTAIEAALLQDDGPACTLPLGGTKQSNIPTVTGTAKSAYMVYENLYAAIAKIADRAQAAPTNWLRNADFSIGAVSSGNSANPPTAWDLTGASTWTRNTTSSAEGVYNVTVTISANSSIYQVIDVGNSILNSVLASANALHGAVTMRVSSGTAKLVIRGKSSGGGDVFTVTSKNISPSSTPKTYGFVYFLSSDSNTVTKLQLSIESTAGATVQIYGASAGSGVTPSSCILNRDSKQYLALDGGPTAVMRSDFDMGDNDIVNAKAINGKTLTVGGTDPNFTVDEDGNITADGAVNANTLTVGGANPNFTVDDSGNVVADGNVSAAGALSGATLTIGGSNPNLTVDADGNLNTEGEVYANTLEVSGTTIDTNGNTSIDGTLAVSGTTTFGTVGSPSVVTIHRAPTAGTDAVNKAYADGLIAAPAYISFRKRGEGVVCLTSHDMWEASPEGGNPFDEQIIAGIQTARAGVYHVVASYTAWGGSGYEVLFRIVKWSDGAWSHEGSVYLGERREGQSVSAIVQLAANDKVFFLCSLDGNYIQISAHSL